MNKTSLRRSLDSWNLESTSERGERSRRPTSSKRSLLIVSSDKTRLQQEISPDSKSQVCDSADFRHCTKRGQKKSAMPTITTLSVV
ncbi:hypothetical protein J6590_070055 [Homalodisca vitripennis]|nr:hypothetical protein J6590_070055 [Homalodisca vitripennis]